jgi:AAT family amino acid transporter
MPVDVHAVQGWSSIIPRFSAVEFVSFYIEIPVVIVMHLMWMLVTRPTTHIRLTAGSQLPDTPTASTPLIQKKHRTSWRYSDLVDLRFVDLRSDEFQESEGERHDSEEHARWWRRVRSWSV